MDQHGNNLEEFVEVKQRKQWNTTRQEKQHGKKKSLSKGKPRDRKQRGDTEENEK